MQKWPGRDYRSILMSSADRVALIDGQLMQLLWKNNTHALPADYKCLSNKTEQSIYRCLLEFCLTFSAPPQILAASTVFFCPIPETKKWWVMVSFGATAAGLFWTVNVCWASCNKQGQRSKRVARFHGVTSRTLFEVLESYVAKIKQTLNNELKFHIVNIY